MWQNTKNSRKWQQKKSTSRGGITATKFFDINRRLKEKQIGLHINKVKAFEMKAEQPWNALTSRNSSNTPHNILTHTLSQIQEALQIEWDQGWWRRESTIAKQTRARPDVIISQKGASACRRKNFDNTSRLHTLDYTLYFIVLKKRVATGFSGTEGLETAKTCNELTRKLANWFKSFPEGILTPSDYLLRN